jgi:hypothetical protein
MNKDVEAGLIAILLLGGGIALSLGLAFGVLRVTVYAMSAATVPTTSGAELTAAGLVRLR